MTVARSFSCSLRFSKALPVLGVALLLTACSWVQDWPPEGHERAAAPYPEAIQTAQAAQAMPAVPAPPVSLAAGAQASASVPSHASPAGVQGDQDVMARLAALENEVTLIRNDIKTMMPALTRLADVQQSMRALMADIEPAAGAATNRQAVAAVQQPSAKIAAPVQPVSAPAQAVIRDLRVGEHPDMVRLVFDVSRAETVSVSQNLDNAGRVMQVFLENAGWGAAEQKYFANSPLLHSYSVTQQGARTVVSLRLRQDTDVLAMQTLPGERGSAERLVVDLAK